MVLPPPDFNGRSPVPGNGEAITHKEGGVTSTEASKPSSKKRQSDIQLSKDGVANDSDGSDEGDDDNLNDEGGKRSDPFKRATEDVLKNRKIVRASNKWSAGKNGRTEVGGTFASIKLTHTPPAKMFDVNAQSSIKDSNSDVVGGTGGAMTGSAPAKPGALFGSGFGNVSHGFGSLKSSSTSTNAEFSNGDSSRSVSKSMLFGGGFGSVSSGFGSIKTTSAANGFGTAIQPKSSPSIDQETAQSNNSSLMEKLANPSTAYQSQFPTPSVVDIDNGEQGEDCLCQVRAKLFKMVPEDDSADVDEESATKGDVPSVPSTAGRMESVKNQKGAQDTFGTTEKAGDSTTGQGEGSNKPKLVQKEAGIGPVRILRSKFPRALVDDGVKNQGKQYMTARIVQRQETSGGGATKVILNIRLDKASCTVIRRGDKFVQLNAPNSGNGGVDSSLFKLKTTAEADTLENSLNDVLGLNGKAI